jgi:hypothetical protein
MIGLSIDSIFELIYNVIKDAPYKNIVAGKRNTVEWSTSINSG